MIGYAKGYQWEELDGVVLVRPVPDPQHPSILDNTVREFTAKEATIGHLLEAVHRLYAHDYRSGGWGGSIGGPPYVPGSAVERRPQIQQGMARTISIEVRNTTVRGVLNAIVKTYGEMLWYVTYVGDDSSYENCRISFRSADGRAVTATAHSQK